MPENANFVHLNVHSEYSLVDGLVTIDGLVNTARQKKIPAIALTDLNNLFGTVKFYTAAIAAGIKPIIGAECQLYQAKEPQNPYRVLLLCQNTTGYKNLSRLISRGYQSGQKNGVVTLEHAWLKDFNQGLLLILGRTSDVGQAIVNDELNLAQEQLAFWTTYFPNRVYLEVQRIGRDKEEHYLNHVLTLAIKHHIPVVATNAVRFLEEDDFDAHEARVCISQGFTLADPTRPAHYTRQQYFRSAQEMNALFADLSPAVMNSIEIAKRCNLTLELGKYYLPDYPVPNELSIGDYFKQLAKQGLEDRLKRLFDTQAPDFEQARKPYDERLSIEMDVIIRMGFVGYFLVVADFIQWAKQQKIPVGPGRGSGAGSLVAYALKITDLDPLAYDLLFERFLNPERVSMPDFDIDFCMEGRDRVIDYVAQKYGRNSVSQIITFGTMAAKAVVRDVGRVLGHPYGFVDKIAKLIPFELGITLDKALAQEPMLLDRYNQEEEVRDLLDLGRKLEGIARNAGKHAGGVVIAPTDLTDFCPLYCEENSTQIVSQFDKDDVESIGLVKFDFLGLRTLTIIDWAVQAVNEKRAQLGEEPIDITLIPVDSPAAYELMQSCKTTAIFQLESRGMKDLVKRLKPDNFEDIVALVALFRPGPLQSGMVDDFIDRKHGRAAVAYPHPELEPILKTTYGVILYQEQVMQIAQVLAGYTLGAADMLRRAMGKKKPEEMAKQRKIFMEGAVGRGVDGGIATTIFDLMEKFAGYGFNKSHSAAYALLSYQTAWLKAHYPAEFMAAVLSSDMDKTDKVVIFFEECRQMNLTVLKPNINQSFSRFKVSENDVILYGLGAVKGAGVHVLESIIEERNQRGPFKDLFDFCQRIDLKKANRRLLEALIRSGAMDHFGEERSVLLASLDLALKFTQQQERNASSGQLDLFAMLSNEMTPPAYVSVPAWSDEIRLEGEKESLGFYWSGHPLDRYREELNAFTTTRIGELNAQQEHSVVIAGMVSSVRFIQTRRGDRMAFMALEDGTGVTEIAVFSDVLEKSRQWAAKDQMVVVEGDVSFDEYSGGFKMGCTSLSSIAHARDRYAQAVQLNIVQANLTPALIEKMDKLLQRYCHGRCPVTFQYYTANSLATVNCGDKWRVYPEDDLLEQLYELLGRENVMMIY